jgi:hypothetical protein
LCVCVQRWARLLQINWKKLTLPMTSKDTKNSPSHNA